MIRRRIHDPSAKIGPSQIWRVLEPKKPHGRISQFAGTGEAYVIGGASVAADIATVNAIVNSFPICIVIAPFLKIPVPQDDRALLLGVEVVS